MKAEQGFQRFHTNPPTMRYPTGACKRLSIFHLKTGTGLAVLQSIAPILRMEVAYNRTSSGYPVAVPRRELMYTSATPIKPGAVLSPGTSHYSILKDSRNFVVKLPLLKSSFFMSCKWKGIVVLMPSITYSLKARYMVAMASSRVWATVINLPIMLS